ncbi:hypothetical protein HZB04_01245 [Candidatus Wolfebacteria bacterium]|nr:hypothetical protein [Candidatus Wolfebacteria bacterium]
MAKKYLLIAAIIILIALGGFYYWQKFYKVSVEVKPAIEAPKTFGEQISGETITNPAETIPQTNPYEAKTNPFEEVKTNPYSDVYKNPFAK